ncbi:MAG: hypothetical protein GX117_10310 [Candidatus Hydrogenedentes bacterium]|nr:hypothetical protein [Candidatus Hydrogenedentota bacterium]
MAKGFQWLLCVLVVICAVSAMAVSPRDFGALGDGIADDTEALQQAVLKSETGRVYFPKGTYRITQSIDIALADLGPVSLDGAGGGSRVVMAGAGPAFRFIGNHKGTASPLSFDPEVSEQERMPYVGKIEIVGDHPEAEGIQFTGTVQSLIEGTLIRNVRNGLVFSGRNRDVIITGSHIYNCSGVGVFFDHVNLHQAIVADNHISYCKRGGFYLLGGEVRNVQITGNDIEYNYDKEEAVSADLWIDVADGSVEEGTIASNTIQAVVSPGGANIRFEAPEKPEERGRAGLWTITGNLIGSQNTNIHLKNVTGVSVSGNHIYTGAENAIHLEGARHIVVSGNSLDQDHNRGKELNNGVRMENCDGILFQANLLNDACAGDAESGGAVSVQNCREVLIANCQIFEARHRGVYVANSKNISVAGCQVLERNDRAAMIAPIVIGEGCSAVQFRDNMYSVGREGGILVSDETVLSGNMEIN